MLQLFKKKKKEKLPARIRGNACLNCNINLEGEENFCPDCGQRNNINSLSFKLVVHEFFGDIFSYDSRLWHTIIPLILKPGKVAYQFILGKRKNLVNPFRTYLTVSLIFFLVYGLINTIGQYNGDGTKKAFFNINDTDKDLSKAEKDSIVNAAMSKLKKDIPIQLDSVLLLNNVNMDSIGSEKALKDSLKNKAVNGNEFGKKLQAFYGYYEEHKELPPAQALDSLGYKNNFWNRFY